MLELSPVLTIVEATSARKIPVQCNAHRWNGGGGGAHLLKRVPPVRHYIATVFSLQRRPDVCASALCIGSALHCYGIFLATAGLMSAHVSVTEVALHNGFERYPDTRAAECSGGPLAVLRTGSWRARTH